MDYKFLLALFFPLGEEEIIEITGNTGQTLAKLLN
jgi:hypothetical protein